MDISLLEKKKRLLAMVFACTLSSKAKQLQLLQMRRRKNQRRVRILILMQHFLSVQKKRKLWMKQRFGKFWELDVPNNDENFFYESFRMSRESFEILCQKVKGIGKKDSNFRECIPLRKRVAIALYTLRSSAEYVTVGRLFGVSKTMVGKILKDFCAKVWKAMAPEYLPSDFLTEDKVEECVKGFADIGFPQCLGAIDGCHIEVRPGAEDATDYYNYKGWYSTVLFAMVDYRYRFMYINVGAPGRCNDSQIFEKSLLKKALENSPILKQKSKAINGLKVPVLVLGDSAFRFSQRLMKPYPFAVTAAEKQKTFNYQLSKARRVVENAFGHLKAPFRRIGKGIDNHIKYANLIIKCCCVLHNFLNARNDLINQTWAQQQKEYEVVSNFQQPEEVNNTFNDHDVTAEQIRNAIASSFCTQSSNISDDGVLDSNEEVLEDSASNCIYSGAMESAQ